MQVFVRDPFTMVTAPVQCDVDRVSKGSHFGRLPRSSASVGVRVEQRLFQLAVLAPETDRGRTLRLVAEGADVDLSIAALAFLFGRGAIAHLSFSNAAATSFCKSRPTRRPSEVGICELSSLWSAILCSIS